MAKKLTSKEWSRMIQEVRDIHEADEIAEKRERLRPVINKLRNRLMPVINELRYKCEYEDYVDYVDEACDILNKIEEILTF